MSSNPYPLRAVVRRELHDARPEGIYIKLYLECTHEEIRHISRAAVNRIEADPNVNDYKLPKRVRCPACEPRANYGTQKGKSRPKKGEYEGIFERGRKRLVAWWQKLRLGQAADD